MINPSKVVTVLKDAKHIIAEPDCWTQGTFARNKRGQSVEMNDRDAVCWCALGALFNAASKNHAIFELTEINNIINDAAVKLFNQRITAVNDNETKMGGNPESFANVHRVFDLAIEAAERAAS